jgi:hypothetical protein
MADEYKALTFINLPFLDGGAGRQYSPGSMISRSDFEESVELGESAIGESEWEGQTSADDMISHLIEFGSLSEDPDAELHPAHRPVVPGAPTMGGLVEQAKSLVAQYEETGEEVPPELQALADSRALLGASDEAAGGEQNA